MKDKVVTIILCLLILGLFILVSKDEDNLIAKRIYTVYLDGNVIGNIEDKDELFNLIDSKQASIKKKYKVNNVYPPNSLKIVENYSYQAKITPTDNIYNKIEELQDFTILGYEVKIGEYGEHQAYSIYVLDKNVFYEALKTFVLTFISESDYEDFVNGVEKKLDDIGTYYDNMKFLESISIREKYISINENIHEEADKLAQELLFGFGYQNESYIVKEGDTISSISEEHTLNVQEFLVANPKYTSEDSLLVIGDQVNITLINPIISFSYVAHEKKEEEYAYDNVTERDTTKPSSYSEITTPGVTGLSIITSNYEVVNGEQSNEITIESSEEIRKKVDQVTTKGRKEAVWGWERTEDTGSGWRWPTANPYAITSYFAPRWGKYHNGIDISGTGFGSPIYAANDGTIIYTNNTCPDYGSYPNGCGSGYGNYVMIDHGNNIYTVYAHLTHNVKVAVGQNVARGKIIGYMGDSGQSTGTHLHFGLSYGEPKLNPKWADPRSLYK